VFAEVYFSSPSVSSAVTAGTEVGDEIAPSTDAISVGDGVWVRARSVQDHSLPIRWGVMVLRTTRQGSPRAIYPDSEFEHFREVAYALSGALSAACLALSHILP